MQESEQHGGKLLSIFSVHGGVGKSLLAANLGVILAREMRQRIGLADLHLGGGATLSQRLQLTHDVSVLEWFCHERQRGKWHEEFFVSHSSGLHLLTGTYDTGRARCLSWDALQAGLRALQATFPLTIVDLHPALDMPALCALKSSDLILFLVRLDRSAWVGTVQALATLKVLQIPERRIRLVPNLVGVGRQSFRTLFMAGTAGPELYPSLTWDPRTVADAEASGKLPADLPGRPLARALQAIAKRVQAELVTTRRTTAEIPDETAPDPQVDGGQIAESDVPEDRVSEARPDWQSPQYTGARLREHWRRCREMAYVPTSSRRKLIRGSVIPKSPVIPPPDKGHPTR